MPARGGDREGSAQGAGDLHEGAVCLVRAVRRPGDSEEFAEDGLGSGAGVGDRKRASYVSEAQAMEHVAGYC